MTWRGLIGLRAKLKIPTSVVAVFLAALPAALHCHGALCVTAPESIGEERMSGRAMLSTIISCKKLYLARN